MCATLPSERTELLEHPTAMNVAVGQTDENGRGIQGGLRVASHDSLQRQRITVRERFAHPGVRGGD